MGGSAGVVTTLLRCPLAMLRMSWLGRRGTGSVGSTKPPWHGGRGFIRFCYWIVYGVCPPHEAALAWWWRCVCVVGGGYSILLMGTVVYEVCQFRKAALWGGLGVG